MTFLEELQAISEKVELKHKIDRQLDEIKAKMKVAAENGHRAFWIEFVNPKFDTFSCQAIASNRYIVATSHKAWYLRRLKDFLYDLGFTENSMTETATVNLEGYIDTNAISVMW